MVKIKGWKKFSSSPNRIVWTNEKRFKGNFLDVQFFAGKWRAEAREGGVLLYVGDSKKEAVSAAVDYMRRNPNG